MDKNSSLKKAIIFDLDNTLWQGVIGEGDVTPNMGLINELKLYASRGVIIGICSKNNAEDVQAKLVELGVEPVISVQRINWQHKATNLKAMAVELNIGLDAIVLVDDQQFEREMVSDLLPEVLCIHPFDLTTTVNKWFDLSGSFTKTIQYRQNFERAKFAEQCAGVEDFLTKLDMVLRVDVNNRAHHERIVELCQKTNQFNLTTERYSWEAIDYALRLDWVYTLTVKDRFGDNGVVGCAILRMGRIDAFMLSCRVLGRNIELAFLDYILQHQRSLGSKTVVGKYVASAKNSQVKDFYARAGFKFIDQQAVFNCSTPYDAYIYDLTSYETIAPKYFRYE